MPQFTHFPRLPPGEYKAALDRFLRALREMPATGEKFSAFRARLKRADMWSREHFRHLLRFLRMPHTDPMVPSALVRRVIDAPGLDEARSVFADRLYTVNPLLMKVVLERLEERVHSSNEVLKFVDSFAYPGNRITGPEVRAWVAFCQGLGLFKPIGIRLGLTKQAKPFLTRAHALDIDDFLEEDQDEPLPTAPGKAAPKGARQTPPAAPSAAFTTGTAPAALAPAAPAPVTATPVTAAPAPTGPSPLGRGRKVPVSRFLTHEPFSAEVLTITTERLTDWWAEVSEGGDGDHVTPQSVGLTPDVWMEDAPRALFRCAVFAALVERHASHPGQARAVFEALDRAGVLDALHDGTNPDDAPALSDTGALMLASVIARRCAEAPDLATDLEKARTAEAVFEQLDSAFGRGLFAVELFRLMQCLGAIGAVRGEGLEDYVARPDRSVRDTLFRLGFIERPYAPRSADLVHAARAARQAVPGVARPDEVLRRFAARAGCSFGCTQRRRCDLPCRERADQG